MGDEVTAPNPERFIIYKLTFWYIPSIFCFLCLNKYMFYMYLYLTEVILNTSKKINVISICLEHMFSMEVEWPLKYSATSPGA